MDRSDRSLLGILIAALGALLLLVGCNKGNSEQPAPAASSAAKAEATDTTITLQGSGASFPAPLYSRWFREYGAKNPSVRVNYQATGSGAGIKAFTAGQ